MTIGSNLRVAVLGADSPIGLTVVRELGERGVRVFALGRDQRALARTSRHTHAFALIEKPLAQWLPRFVAANDIGAVLAISEHHLIELAAMGPVIGKCRLLVPEPDKLALVLDKPRTLDLAAGLGIDVPSSWQPLTGEDHAAIAAGLAYPVAVKWADPNAVSARLGAAGIALEKVEYANDASGLLALLARYDVVGIWPLVQTWCPGHGLGQMLHMQQGRATLRFQHRRLREFPPTGGVSAFCEVVPLAEHAALMERSEALLSTMGWEGPAMVEYRHDPASGRSWLMEINGRFWGSLPLAYHCGAHFGWETYACAMLGEDAAVQGRSNAVAMPLRRARYLIPDAKGLVMLLRDGKVPVFKRIGAVARFIADFLDPRVRWFVWSWRDPAPLFADLAGVVRKLWPLGKRGTN
ncbi:carboxylate--amine ligase [Novosphingobium sp.]|uniref:carboxylate--amine ligase n=1 Tax=Novosphingobium sp. TaxID=1874826 RepID=UPI0025CEAD2D|nr:carboxylate--amine ligase [Novosphingobium sp.]